MKKLIYLIRSNHLIVLSFVVFFLTTILILLEIDRQYYQAQKKSLIISYSDQLFSELSKNEFEIINQAESILLTRDIVERDDKIGKLKENLKTLIESDNFIIKIAIEDNSKKEVLSYEDKDKQKRLNGFTNSLIMRNFQGAQIKGINHPDFRKRDEIIGRVIATYTSPQNFQPVIDITKKFWLYSFMIVLLLSAIYIYLLKFLLFPVKKVIASLSEDNLDRPYIINSPSSLLEKVYNNLAREASLNKLNYKIQEFASKSATLDTTRILEEFPEYIASLFRFTEVIVYELRYTKDQGYIVVTSFFRESAEKNLLTSIEEEIKTHLNNAFGVRVGELEVEDTLISLKNGNAPEICYISPIEIRNKGEIVTIISIVPNYKSLKNIDPWKKETLKRISELVRSGLKQIEFQRKIIFKEKSEANISLSRNLGHDLTNIIATSKLDLLAVQHFLSLPGDEIMSNPQKEKIFKEALSGLLNNTKFLQEIVNLYRSFTYIKRPKFEMVDINQSLDEIVTIFDISISRNIKIVKNYDVNIPPLKIEQRLVKLAIFNILTNAVDSIKRNTSQTSDDEGELKLTTQYDKAHNEVIISIKDNGTGIRNQRGELATPHEIERIFYLGYSTKKNEGGEGLGLNWVWTIINDFHRGKITPRNHPEGGAEFTIRLKKDFDPDKLEKEKVISAALEQH